MIVKDRRRMTTSRTLTTISRDNAVLFTVGRWMDTMVYGIWYMVYGICCKKERDAE